MLLYRYPKSFLLASFRSQKQLSVTSSSKTYAMATLPSGTPRQFAPLGDSKTAPKEGLQKLKGVVFDVDGTLW